ncbi:MAG: hypothetical protein JWQ09_2344, partial [Segetibacter sp.]|nr:hypothetical protein [Segetibacter sp.]
IKTDSWHVFFYEQLRRVYPKVPFVLLYRHPAEVLNSHKKLRGMHVVPGVIEKEIFGFDEDISEVIDLDMYAARVIERYLQEYINISAKDDHILLLNYSEGIMPVIEKIGVFTGNDFNDNVLSLMRERSGFHGKYPLQTFTEASAPNNTPAHLLKAVELYEQLEQIRSYQNSTAPV